MQEPLGPAPHALRETTQKKEESAVMIDELGFDNEKYLKMQSEHIRSRIRSEERRVGKEC